jgi:cupin 2 domain-containing protein
MNSNLFAEIPTTLPSELWQDLLATANVRIERIVSHGHASPEGFWYDQDHDEWVMVVTGAAALRFADDQRLVRLRAGDYLNIPAHVKHRVEWTTPEEPTIWLAVHYRG